MAAAEDRVLAGRISHVDRATQQARVTFLVLVCAGSVFLTMAVGIGMREMSYRQHAQADAQRQAATLQLILDSVGEGISVADTSGKLTLNRAGAQMMKREGSTSRPEAWPGEFGVFQLDGRPLDARDSTIVRALRGEPSDDVEWLVRNESVPDGIVISASGRPLRDSSGKIIGAVSVFRDVSMRKRYETELQQAIDQTVAANRELESFSYSVAHDLRAPLRAIDGFSQALLEDYAAKLDEHGRDYLNRVRGAAQRMGALIDDLLALSRLSRSEMKLERINLSQLGREVAAELSKRDPERAVDFRIDEGLTARADARLVRVALENLLGNAWKFTSKKPAAHIELGARNGSFFVRDDGVGFDMAHAEKLFGAFQRLHAVRDFEGTGIGLATVARIVHRHGGRVWAEGAVGQGATFFFTLAAGKTT
jgi:signal transduction histidine kinase